MASDRVTGTRRQVPAPASTRVATPSPAEVIKLPIATLAAAAGEGVEFRDVYLERFNAAATGLRIELRMATPAWAKGVLVKNNTKNRKLSQSWERIFAAIERGAWQVCEVIAFDWNDVLVDGQHRLQAIAEGKVAVPVLVLYGVNPEAFAVLDTGKRRNGSDVLGINGETHTHALAAALNWQWRWDHGQIRGWSNKTIPNDEILAVLGRNPGLATSAAWGHGGKTKLIPPGLLTFIHYQFTQLDPAATEAFFRLVIDGLDVTEGSHPHLLRRRLEDFIGKHDNTTQVEICALVFKTWTRMRLDESPGSKLIWNADKEKFPEIL